MKIKNSFPALSVPDGCRSYRLGVTSYVYPADILPNVEALAPVIDDVELVLFESRPRNTERLAEDVLSNLPDGAMVARLGELARRHALSYTVHFPIDMRLGAEHPAERKAMLGQILGIVENTRSLAPFGYILHLEGVYRADPPERVRAWRRDLAGQLPQIIRAVGDAKLLCVENLDYPFEWCDPLLDDFGLGVCVDLGHLWRYGADVGGHLQRYRSRARVMHLHGESCGRDHLPLTMLIPSRLREMRQALQGFAGVVTLELFEYEAVRDSLAILAAQGV